MTPKITKYELLPGQGKFLFDIPTEAIKVANEKGETYIDIAGYISGVGAGKTWCGSLRGLLFALRWPKCKGLVGALSEDLLNTTTNAKYLEHMENIGFKEGVHWWFEDRSSVIRLKNGSSIKFKTMSD